MTMISRDWRQREQNAKDRLADQQEKRADSAFQAREAQLRQLEYDHQARLQAERERLRLEREGPVRPVAALFREKFKGDLPEVLDVLSKPQGVAKLLPLLKAMVADDLRVHQQVAEAARVEAEKARIVADGERRVREAAEREAKRKAKTGEPATGIEGAA